MSSDNTIVEKLDALYDMGRDFVERAQTHGFAVEYEFDQCSFDKWRRKVNDLLYTLGGCEDLYYQRFSKEVINPRIRELEEGLRILSAVRDEVAARHAKVHIEGEEPGRLSVSFH
ncbi:MAG: hypothetical protein HY913_17500 [Desulfomonile tiedjei]|nr:hypothetical protein [Desulfomonile tiedjei]